MLGIGRKRGAERAPLDFMPTPETATLALVLAEQDRWRKLGRLWEPACGNGKMANVLRRAGVEVACSDIVDRGYPGTIKQNFLDFEAPLGQGVITNPPYFGGLPEKFVLNALRLRVPYVALLLKANYLHAGRAHRLFARWRPARYYHLTWRVDFTGEGASPWSMTWYVFDAEATTTEVHLLREPSLTDVPEPAPDLLEGAA